jgi:hypothetical protein
MLLEEFEELQDAIKANPGKMKLGDRQGELGPGRPVG